MDEVAAAIADPVRREILEALREGALPARRIAERFPISRPAVSRHLRVLRECGLVHDTLVGRERMYRLDTAPLTEVGDWIARFAPAAGFWNQRLDALETEVHRTRRDRRARRAEQLDARRAEQVDARRADEGRGEGDGVRRAGRGRGVEEADVRRGRDDLQDTRLEDTA
ncbi:ArsR/SmtB family transcription factor [Paractinoplanes lichenicola]|uniref:Winged helix-turn-helix transcriptional regulator n=1 Tax=Paractinoplanes lichenicola TaxID=2802976 RepID=A0ABS1VTE4_9ACTN|nr:metalloregulator ArsR/SmtB family transcription factor [Actinoplanes lichenicola]MBL7257736.1 winged helix-turn-helix transcriptional regulator [Actinoplanes lichenicola]